MIFNFIESIQRLGVAYHFENDIKETISRASNAVDETTSSTSSTSSSHSLYMTALRFRLLRQHGFSASSGILNLINGNSVINYINTTFHFVPNSYINLAVNIYMYIYVDVFDKFRGKEGRFMDSLRKDVKGLLSLYEASHFGVDGEEAKSFTVENLNSLMLTMDSDLVKQVQQSLQIPLRWTPPRMEARNFIDKYQNYETKNVSLLELAKLDYNLVQSVHQQELKELAR